MTARRLILDVENWAHRGWSYETYNTSLIKEGLVPGGLMCWAAKWYGEPKMMFRSVFHDGPDAMVGDIHGLLDEADQVIHYNGTRHDMPILNTVMLEGNLGPPSPYRQIDMYRVVRSLLKLPYYSLDYVTRRLGLGEKQKHEGFALWLSCLDGDPKAWQRMRAYNKQDVVITEALYDRLLPWIRNHPHVALGDDINHTCPSCGSTSLQKRGSIHVGTSAFQRYQCNACRAWSRGTSILAHVETRSVA